jgi:hypothetical protein
LSSEHLNFDKKLHTIKRPALKYAWKKNWALCHSPAPIRIDVGCEFEINKRRVVMEAVGRGGRPVIPFVDIEFSTSFIPELPPQTFTISAVPSHRRRFIYYFNALPGGNWALCRQKALHLMSVFDLRVRFYYQQVV